MQAIPGFFVGSDEKDHHVGKYTIKQAVELCEPDPKCFSFTFMGSADTEDEVDVWFKAGQESRLMQSAGWATYAKVLVVFFPFLLDSVHGSLNFILTP